MISNYALAGLLCLGVGFGLGRATGDDMDLGKAAAWLYQATGGAPEACQVPAPGEDTYTITVTRNQT